MARRNRRNDYDSGWGRRQGESDEDYQERMEDWNEAINND
jgi:hypothetical protein